ncbi:unnamed protein product [Parnassius apollo]|uniref:(apollo) hypothetical protein n=1 Tax=Parnassius apollo TaxID=110799 RepID=A0A8S3Y7S1_PARAO|nr:unnamed protein product [Parnassius apollo]
MTREPYHVKEFKYDEFLDLKHLAGEIMKNRTKDEKGKQVQWLKIKRIKYVKGEDRKIYFNYDMSDEFYVMDIGDNPSTFQLDGAQNHNYSTRKKKRLTENDLPVSYRFPDQLNCLYKEPLKISAAKKKDLLNLCRKGIIPEEVHGWFENLNVDSQAIDKLPEPAVDETVSGEVE